MSLDTEWCLREDFSAEYPLRRKGWIGKNRTQTNLTKRKRDFINRYYAGIERNRMKDEECLEKMRYNFGMDRNNSDIQRYT